MGKNEPVSRVETDAAARPRGRRKVRSPGFSRSPTRLPAGPHAGNAVVSVVMRRRVEVRQVVHDVVEQATVGLRLLLGEARGGVLGAVLLDDLAWRERGGFGAC